MTTIEVLSFIINSTLVHNSVCSYLQTKRTIRQGQEVKAYTLLAQGNASIFNSEGESPLRKRDSTRESQRERTDTLRSPVDLYKFSSPCCISLAFSNILCLFYHVKSQHFVGFSDTVLFYASARSILVRFFCYLQHSSRKCRLRLMLTLLHVS